MNQIVQSAVDTVLPYIPMIFTILVVVVIAKLMDWGMKK